MFPPCITHQCIAGLSQRKFVRFRWRLARGIQFRAYVKDTMEEFEALTTGPTLPPPQKDGWRKTQRMKLWGTFELTWNVNLLVEHGSTLLTLHRVRIEGKNYFILSTQLANKTLCLTELKNKEKTLLRKSGWNCHLLCYRWGREREDYFS